MTFNSSFPSVSHSSTASNASQITAATAFSSGAPLHHAQQIEALAGLQPLNPGKKSNDSALQRPKAELTSTQDMQHVFATSIPLSPEAAKQLQQNFIVAVENNDLQAIQDMIQRHPHGEFVDAVATNGMSALMIAAQEDYTDVLKLLLEASTKHPDLLKPANDGCSALMFAAAQNHTNTTKALLDASVKYPDLLKPDNDGWSALIFAAQNGHIGIVKILLFVLPEDLR